MNRKVVGSLVVLVLLGVACGKPDSAASQEGVGSQAPAFTLPSAEGGDLSLADFIGKQPVLLYFSMGPG